MAAHPAVCMGHAEVLRPGASGIARDILALGKPRLSSLVLCTTAVGIWVAPPGLGAARSLAVLAGTAAAVAAANTLNNVKERDTDRFMQRTAGRPLAAGRLSWRAAQRGAWALAAVALAVLASAGNLITALLGLLALVSYAYVYTPMKRVSAWAVVVGAVPGALPPLMGWSAATGGLGPPGWALFALLFVWQLPHFLAIAVALSDDYAEAGLRVVPAVWGVARTRWATVALSAAFCAAAWAPAWARLGGRAYRLGAPVAGLGLVACSLWGVESAAPRAWARRVFVASIAALAALLALLILQGPGR